MSEERIHLIAPIPPWHLTDAGRLWWCHFGGPGPAPAMRGDHGAVVLRDDTVIGVAGFRDAGGGFSQHAPILAGLLFRPAPPTADLVLDGIAVTDRRAGAGRLLIRAGLDHARNLGRPGLRAEVALRNRTALAFFQSLGFAEVTRGRYGWPWTGQVVVLRRDAS